MALREAHSDAEAQPVTPMEEIRRRRGMLFDDFTDKYPDWEWSERRLKSLTFDDPGRT